MQDKLIDMLKPIFKMSKLDTRLAKLSIKFDTNFNQNTVDYIPGEIFSKEIKNSLLNEASQYLKDYVLGAPTNEYFLDIRGMHPLEKKSRIIDIINNSQFKNVLFGWRVLNSLDLDFIDGKYSIGDKACCVGYDLDSNKIYLYDQISIEIVDVIIENGKLLISYRVGNYELDVIKIIDDDFTKYLSDYILTIRQKKIKSLFE